MQINNLHELGWNNYFESLIDLDEREAVLPFRVVSVERNLIECLGLDSEYKPHSLQLSTYFWRNELPEDHPAIGDWLLVNHDLEPQKLLDRNTLIKRKGAGKEAFVQLIAANIDTLFIVTSCNQEFNINRIERYLSIAAESDIYCVLVLTKMDQCEDTSVYTDVVTHNYPQLPVELVNAIAPETLDTLQKWVRPGQTVALLGSSGVGKSTIINGLLGEVEQETGGIRESDSKGRHTTTSRSLHRLPGGGLLLDNPGMRELQIVDSEAGIKSTFADIDSLAAKCRFKDCQHVTEPGCAVLAQVEAGELEQRRLDNYHKLMSEQERNSATVAERRHQDRAFGKFIKHAQASSRQFKTNS
ncbi:MAG TPA: ribosome small subunit-dependent GTPase A [Oceanospirillaceae bacterium]|mgnify:CR=1 FL=1|nr:ribosome small subunit-dependent GTPase A [Oceanospirillaceae bacterium]